MDKADTLRNINVKFKATLSNEDEHELSLSKSQSDLKN